MVRWQLWEMLGTRGSGGVRGRAQLGTGYFPLLPPGLQGRVRAGEAQHLGANPAFSSLSGARVGRRSKMKLWDVVAVCVVLLNTVSTSPLPAANMPEDYPDQFDEVVDFIQATIKRLRRSPDKQTPIFSRRERNRQSAATNVENSSRKGRRNQKGKNRGCVLTEIHLNVTDLDLGYETKEELIFRYCSGSCDAVETTYDKILKNLTRKKKLVNDKVRQACCRPTAFDDDLSFLDDNLVYHILKKHSAKRCGCV
ncbi:glial cell line-derived neurotrophic factor isoform X2 [Numida meleagris]|uniref:glial cell line-derived neurotrophic factor isoform X2 n=1 Tax=Numida meleagris TaxID=8996 RepID=UPI000B3E1B50|nr:glial cell line-derived neurotrophic factor isoform X2 [Numida meleagris]